MILEDADGTLVWSSNTGGKSVSGLNLTETGNLVLFNRSNGVAWQSFEHTTDTLLPGQILFPGQKLTSSILASNLTQGLQLHYSLVVDFSGLSAYIESSPPQKYFESYLFENPYVQFVNGSFNGFSIPPASGAQFMKLEPDGRLKIYEWAGPGANNWKVVADLLTPTIGECGYPTACGKYSVCSNGQCACPEETGNQTGIFKQIDYRKPNLGCTLNSPLSCNYSQYQTLVELKGMSYFVIESLLQNADRESLQYKTDRNNCKKICLWNCSCQAAVFLYDQEGKTSRGGCLLLSEVFSLINKDGWYDDISVFIKVQRSSPIAKLDPSLVNSPRKKSRKLLVILGSSVGSCFGIFFTIAYCFFRSKRKNQSEELDDFCVDHVAGMPIRFTYDNLKSMTSNFSNKLGEGGFGSVFEGILDNGTKVAVKRLEGLGQVKKSFLAEVGTIGSIHHVNLVRLIGFCAEKSQRLLVYEYMPKGSMDKWIFHKRQGHTLGWQSRRKIILDIAKGLAYLHEECRRKILHLDIKPQNILLDEDFSAKVSDFGLAKLIDKDQSQVMTTLRGTPGYMAPEWLSSIITEKVDVYSYGVVVLEILCGRKNLDRSQPEEDMHLLSRFQRKAEEEELFEMVDKESEDMQSHKVEVVEMMKVAAWCLQIDFSRRPSMSVVVKVLEGSMHVENNLDYSFTNIGMPRSIAADVHQDDITGAATQLIASALSGPR